MCEHCVSYLSRFENQTRMINYFQELLYKIKNTNPNINCLLLTNLNTVLDTIEYMSNSNIINIYDVDYILHLIINGLNDVTIMFTPFTDSITYGRDIIVKGSSYNIYQETIGFDKYCNYYTPLKYMKKILMFSIYNNTYEMIERLYDMADKYNNLCVADVHHNYSELIYEGK